MARNPKPKRQEFKRKRMDKIRWLRWALKTYKSGATICSWIVPGHPEVARVDLQIGKYRYYKNKVYDVHIHLGDGRELSCWHHDVVPATSDGLCHKWLTYEEVKALVSRSGIRVTPQRTYKELRRFHLACIARCRVENKLVKLFQRDLANLRRTKYAQEV